MRAACVQSVCGVLVNSEMHGEHVQADIASAMQEETVSWEARSASSPEEPKAMAKAEGRQA
jgi:hypothetical protein